MDTVNYEYTPSGEIRLNLDVGLYSRDAIISTAYLFTDKCHINLQSYREKLAIVVFSQTNSKDCDLKLIVKDFLNELIDQQLRYRIDCETKDIKKMIIAEAFAPLENVAEDDIS